MTVQYRDVESGEAIRVFLINVGTILEKLLHFIHVAFFACRMESGQAKLVFKESDNPFPYFRPRIAKESGYVPFQSNNGFHKRMSGGHLNAFGRLVLLVFMNTFLS